MVKNVENVQEMKGIVEAVSEKPDRNGKLRYGFKIGKEWYNGFGKCPVEKGREVTVQFIKDGQWNNVEHIDLGECKAPEKEKTVPIAKGNESGVSIPTFDWKELVERRLEIILYVINRLDEEKPDMEAEQKKDIAVSIGIDVSKKENIKMIR